MVLGGCLGNRIFIMGSRVRVSAGAAAPEDCTVRLACLCSRLIELGVRHNE